MTNFLLLIILSLGLSHATANSDSTPRGWFRATCQVAFTRLKGHVEMSAPEFADQSDEEFLMAVGKLFRPKFHFNPDRMDKADVLKIYYPRRIIGSRVRRWFGTVKPYTLPGPTELPPVSENKFNTADERYRAFQRSWWVRSQRFGVYRQNQAEPIGLLEYWTEPTDRDRKGVMVRQRIYHFVNGQAVLLHDETKFRGTGIPLLMYIPM